MAARPRATRRPRPSPSLALLLLLFLSHNRAAAAENDGLLIPAQPEFLNGLAAGSSSATADHNATTPPLLLAPQLDALDAARQRLNRAALEAPPLAKIGAQLGRLRSRLARLPAAWGLEEDDGGEAAAIVDFGPLRPPNATAVTAAWGPPFDGGGGDAKHQPALNFASFEDAALLCKNDLFECWRRFGPAKAGALKAALQAEAVRGVEAAAEKRYRQLKGALDWAALAAAKAEAEHHHQGNTTTTLTKKHPKKLRRGRLLDALLGNAADAALDNAVGALAALAAGDAVLAFGEAQAAAAVRVASLLLPVRVALNPRAVVGQTLQLVFDAARTGFRPAMLFPFLTDGRVNNFQELVGFSAQTAVDSVTSGLNAVIAGFDRAARRWWRATSGYGGGGKGGAGDAALAALASGAGGGAALRALLLEGAGVNNGTAEAAVLVERVAASASAAAVVTAGRKEDASAAAESAAAAAPATLPPALSALILRAAATSPSFTPAQRPLADELKATLGVAGDLFVEWARASARDLQRAAAQLDAALPGPSPAEAIRLARRSLERRANATRAALERAFPSKDVLEAADVLRSASDEILAAAEQAAAVAIAPNSPGVLAARDALAGLAKGMRLASRPMAAAADAAFRSPPFLANATLAAVRALAEEGADEVDAAARRVRDDYNGTLSLLAPEAVLAAARRAADRALAGAADASSGLLAVAGAVGGGGKQQQQQQQRVARALAEGLPGAMEPLVRSIARAVSVGGQGANATTTFDGERRAWEEKARLLDARAGGALRDLASRVAALAEAVPVAAEAIGGSNGEPLLRAAAQPEEQQQQQGPSPVAVAAALLDAAAAGRVANARGAMQGALLRLNARNAAADAEDVRDREREEAVQEVVDKVTNASVKFIAARPGVAAAARRLRAGVGGGGGGGGANNDAPSSPPSLAARANVVLARYAERAVEASRTALSRGADASLAAQARAAAMLRRAAAEGGSAASAAAAAARTSAPAAAALARRARQSADVFSRGLTDSLSPVVTEGVRAGERVVRRWLDAAVAVVARGRRL